MILYKPAYNLTVFFHQLISTYNLTVGHHPVMFQPEGKNGHGAWMDMDITPMTPTMRSLSFEHFEPCSATTLDVCKRVLHVVSWSNQNLAPISLLSYNFPINSPQIPYKSLVSA